MSTPDYFDSKADALLGDLFTNGGGEEAHRLVLTSREGRDLGGWGKSALRQKFVRLVKEADRDTRHRCAEAVQAIPHGDRPPGIITSSEAHDACMNARPSPEAGR